MKLHADTLTVELGGRTVLEKASVTFDTGTLTAVIGPNGAGKTTLLRAMAALLPVKEGRTTADDVDLRRLTRREVARRVTYLPQAGEMPFPHSAGDVVLMGRYAHLGRFQSERPEDREHAERALRAVEGWEFRARPVTELSGGEQRRVLVARTLATDAPVMLFDEPVASLDLKHTLQLLDLLRAEAYRGRTIALALHDLNLAVRFCSRFVLLAGGRVLAQGGAAEVLRTDLLREAFDVEAIRVGENGTSHFIFERGKP